MNISQFDMAVHIACTAFVAQCRQTLVGKDWPEKDLWTMFEKFVREKGLEAIQQEHEDDIPF